MAPVIHPEAGLFTGAAIQEASKSIRADLRAHISAVETEISRVSSAIRAAEYAVHARKDELADMYREVEAASRIDKALGTRTKMVPFQLLSAAADSASLERKRVNQAKYNLRDLQDRVIRAQWWAESIRRDLLQLEQIAGQAGLDECTIDMLSHEVSLQQIVSCLFFSGAPILVDTELTFSPFSKPIWSWALPLPPRWTFASLSFRFYVGMGLGIDSRCGFG